MRRALRIAVLAAVTLLVLYLAVRVSIAAGRLADTACSNPHPVLPGWAILLVCVSLFGAGRLAVSLRDESADAGGPPRTTVPGAAGGMAVRIAMALVFLFGVGALAYETVGVWANPWGLAPITHYVRCARSADPLTTTLVAGTLSFFVGHWLWFPGRGRD